MRRLPGVLVNVALALLAAGATFWSVHLVRGGSSSLTKTSATTSNRTVEVAQGTVTATVEADGTLSAATTASASFVTSGTVSAIYAAVGDKVTSGEVLARVDPAAAKRTLAQAEADLDAADAALTRAKAAGSDTSTATNEVTQAQLAVDDASAGVTGTVLKAPMAGTITAVNGTLGGSSGSSGSSSSGGSGGGSSSSSTSSSTSSDGFMEIENLGRLEVTADFSESDATALKAGQAATVTWDALSNATATGKVLSIDPTSTTSNSVVTYGVTVSVGTLPTGAKPGQSVTVDVTTGSASNVTYVNSAAVKISGSRYTVTVKNDDGTTESRTIQVGLKGDDAYQVTSGLTVGETVVIPTSTTSSSSSSSSGSRSGGFGSGSGGGFSGGNGGPPG